MHRHLRSTGLRELASDTLSETLPKIKVKMSILSRYPIHLPALGNPFKEASAGNHFSYSMNDFIKTDMVESTAI